MKKAPGNSSSPAHHHEKNSTLSTSAISPVNTVSPSSGDDIVTALRALFFDQLKDIYWAEQSLTTLFPAMIRRASSLELIDALTAHLSVTEQQISRCEEIFAALHHPLQASTCEAMQGLIDEAHEMMDTTEHNPASDAGLICITQKIEHYEIASYTTLVTWAKQLREQDIAGMLEESLYEEQSAGERLTTIATQLLSAAMQPRALRKE